MEKMANELGTDFVKIRTKLNNERKKIDLRLQTRMHDMNLQ